MGTNICLITSVCLCKKYANDIYIRNWSSQLMGNEIGVAYLVLFSTIYFREGFKCTATSDRD